MLTFIRRFLQINKEEKGFTLIELMVVVAILGILAAVAIPKFSGSTDTAKKGRVVADLRTIESAISMYRADNNDQLPPSLPAGVNALVTDDYLRSIPASPFGSGEVYYINADGYAYYDGDGVDAGEWVYSDTSTDDDVWAD